MMRRYPAVRRGDHLDLTGTGHALWMRDHNPDDWDDETWKAFVARHSTSDEFRRQVAQARRLGHPRPHPTADGWTPPPNSQTLTALMKGRSMPRRERRR